MSRMILTLMSLVYLSGCQCCEGPRYISLAVARFQTLGPGSHRVPPDCCDDCAPHRTFKHKYEPWWDHLVTEHTAQKCAFRALCAYRHECDRPISHHFKMGFISAYEDLALNRKPAPPIVPPQKYWNAFYRSCAGQRYVDDWFAGYDAGLSAGSNSGVSRFHEIYLRRSGANRGWGNACCNNSVDQSNYGYPDMNGAMPDPAAPNFPPMSAPALNAYGTPNPYGVSNFPGVPDPYGVQAN